MGGEKVQVWNVNEFVGPCTSHTSFSFEHPPTSEPTTAALRDPGRQEGDGTGFLCLPSQLESAVTLVSHRGIGKETLVLSSRSTLKGRAMPYLLPTDALSVNKLKKVASALERRTPRILHASSPPASQLSAGIKPRPQKSSPGTFPI